MDVSCRADDPRGIPSDLGIPREAPEGYRLTTRRTERRQDRWAVVEASREGRDRLAEGAM